MSLRPADVNSKAIVVDWAGFISSPSASAPIAGNGLVIAGPATMTFWIRDPDGFGQNTPESNEPLKWRDDDEPLIEQRAIGNRHHRPAVDALLADRGELHENAIAGFGARQFHRDRRLVGLERLQEGIEIDLRAIKGCIGLAVRREGRKSHQQSRGNGNDCP